MELGPKKKAMICKSLFQFLFLTFKIFCAKIADKRALRKAYIKTWYFLLLQSFRILLCKYIYKWSVTLMAGGPQKILAEKKTRKPQKKYNFFAPLH